MLKSKLAQAVRFALQPTSIMMTLMVASAPAFSAEETENTEVIKVVGIKQTLIDNVANSTMRSETDLSVVPRSVQIINAEIMEQQNASSLSDVTKNVSNVSEHNNFGGTRDLFKIRGFEANVYEDGTRVYGLSQDKAVIEDLDSVEVVKGPESVLYGNMNPGGLINLISKQPTANAENEIKVTVDEHGKRRLSLDVNGAANDSGSLLYRFVGVFDDSEGWRDDSDSEQLYIAPSLTWLATEDTSLTFSYKYNKEEIPFDRGTLAVRNSSNTDWEFLDIGETNLGADFSRQERETHKFGIDVDHTVNENWSIRLKARNTQRDTDALNVHMYASSADSYSAFVHREDGASVAFDGSINRYISGGEVSSNTQLYSIENNFDFSIDESEHRLIVGADYTKYTETDQRSLSASWSDPDLAQYSLFVLGTADASAGLYDYYSDDPSDTSFPDDMYDAYEDKQELTEYSLFVQDLIEYKDWNFVLGARYDVFKAKYARNWDENLLAASSAIQNTSSSADTEGNLSFQVGALYQLTQQVSLFANVTSSYLSNGDKYDEVENEWVDSQKGVQYEVGTKLSLINNRLNLTATTFRIELDNVAYAGDVTDSYDVYNQRSQGFEIDGDYAITDDTTALFAYGYTDVKFVDAPDSVSKPVNVPDHTASLWLTHRVSHEWGIGSGINYVGDRAGNRRLAYNYTLPGYSLVDATVWYAPDFANNDLKLQLNVSNLFDEEYYTAGSDSTQNAVYLGSPRTVTLSAAYNF